MNGSDTPVLQLQLMLLTSLSWFLHGARSRVVAPASAATLAPGFQRFCLPLRFGIALAPTKMTGLRGAVRRLLSAAALLLGGTAVWQRRPEALGRALDRLRVDMVKSWSASCASN